MRVNTRCNSQILVDRFTKAKEKGNKNKEEKVHNVCL